MVEVVQEWNEALDTLHRQIAPRFGRAEPRGRARAYLQANDYTPQVYVIGMH